jgi:hypothetical protein
MPLNIFEFIDWISQALRLGEPALPDDTIEALTGGDLVEQALLIDALDELIGSAGVPATGAYECQTVRDLYLHYMLVLALPIPSDNAQP